MPLVVINCHIQMPSTGVYFIQEYTVIGFETSVQNIEVSYNTTKA